MVNIERRLENEEELEQLQMNKPGENGQRLQKLSTMSKRARLNCSLEEGATLGARQFKLSKNNDVGTFSRKKCRRGKGRKESCSCSTAT
eukprot:1553716-Pleurochrysis_carterae.AAC.1